MTARRVLHDLRWRSLRRLSLVAGAVAAAGVVTRIVITAASATSGSDDGPFSSFIRTANGFRTTQSTLESSRQADEESDEDGGRGDEAASEGEWDY